MFQVFRFTIYLYRQYFSGFFYIVVSYIERDIERPQAWKEIENSKPFPMFSLAHIFLLYLYYGKTCGCDVIEGGHYIRTRNTNFFFANTNIV